MSAAGHKVPTFVVLGHYDAMSLKEAREKAPEALRALARGEDPREAERKKARDSVAVVVEEFIKQHVSKLRSAGLIESLLRRELLGQKREGWSKTTKWVHNPAARNHWRDRPIVSIGPLDVVELVERVRDRDGRHPARKLLTYLKKLFKWAINRKVYGLPYASPCALIEPKELFGKFKSRTRILSDDEIAWVWRGSMRLGYPFGPMVRLLLLTGQRRDEVAGARQTELDATARRLTIPPERMKQDEAHSVPLPNMAWALLEELPRFAGDCLFTTTPGARPVSGFSKAKARLDDIIAAMRAKERAGEDALPEEQDKLPEWRLHDLRRTVRSKLSELGVTEVVAELVIGHKQKGILAVYDLYKYDKEKRDALERWGAALRAILAPPPANVVPLRHVTS